MHCRDISEHEFDRIASTLVNIEHQSGYVRTVTGRHPDFGETILLRDVTRCLAVVEDPTLLDISGAGGLAVEGNLLCGSVGPRMRRALPE